MRFEKHHRDIQEISISPDPFSRKLPQFDREEAKRRMAKRSNIGKIQYRVVDELSTLLLAAMHDVCGFGAKRLVALYQAIADMSDSPDYSKLETELKQAGFDVRHELSEGHTRAAFFGTYKREGQDGLMEAIKARIQEYGGGV